MENEIQVRRKAKGIKQAELAALVGISQPSLSQIETGQHTPNVSVAIRVARVLRCRVEDLFIEPDE